jgi:Tfp pilus assembly protein PilV
MKRLAVLVIGIGIIAISVFLLNSTNQSDEALNEYVAIQEQHSK